MKQNRLLKINHSWIIITTINGFFDGHCMWLYNNVQLFTFTDSCWTHMTSADIAWPLIKRLMLPFSKKILWFNDNIVQPSKHFEEWIEGKPGQSIWKCPCKLTQWRTQCSLVLGHITGSWCPCRWTDPQLSQMDIWCANKCQTFLIIYRQIKKHNIINNQIILYSNPVCIRTFILKSMHFICIRAFVISC